MRTNRFAVVMGAMALLGGGLAYGAANKATLASPQKVKRAYPSLKHTSHVENTETLFRGDMAANIGLGCSNTAGTSGGPNDWATKVTSTLTPPFNITTTTYNVFTFNAGATWDVVAWNNGASPGTEIGRTPLGTANGTTGNHTVALPTPITVPAGQQTFYFGLSQGTDVVGVRLGMDTDGATAGTTFIKAPGCGLSAFGTVESIGYPGFWVQSVIVNDVLPVELMNFGIK
jgi:hypothetical protein